MNSEIPELQFILGSGPLSPFDRNLATISLRTDANNPNDGYRVYVSATFGSQIVTLSAGETEFDVVFEIHEAEILINGKRTALQFGDQFHDQNAILSAPKKVSDTISKIRKSNASAGFSNAKIEAGTIEEAGRQENYEDIPRDFDHARIELIKIGKRTQLNPLDGTVVRDYLGWAAFPKKSDEISGVRAELNIKEAWVRLKDPRTESNTPLANLWNKISSSKLKEHKKKKELFSDLIRRLTIKGLQRERTDGSATLDVAGIVCVPQKESISSVGTDPNSSITLQLDEMKLLEFLQCPTGLEAESLKAISNSEKFERLFMPDSSVVSTYEAYANIKEIRICALSRLAAEKKFGRNEIRDLVAAGLIKFGDGVLFAVNPYPDQATDDAFKAFMSRKSTIKFTRDLLQDSPELTPTQIGERVAVHFSKSWKPSTCQSRGHRLRSWAGFIFGNLLVTRRGDPIDRFLNNLSDKPKRRGQPPFMSGKNLARVSALKNRGLNISEIARQLGTSPQVIHNFKRKYPKKWEEIWLDNASVGRAFMCAGFCFFVHRCARHVACFVQPPQVFGAL